MLNLFGDPQSEEQPQRKTKSRKAHLGQFFTPTSVASFMAGEFQHTAGAVRLLDAGAGDGALTEAFVRRWSGAATIVADLYELDEEVLPALNRRIAAIQSKSAAITVHSSDFLEDAVRMLHAANSHRFSHVIMNPPYKKIGTGSRQRALISKCGLETVNLYSGFVGLALKLLAPGGQLVAIIPRSFCNGPYYKPFRRLITGEAAIRAIHLFESRTDAFAHDNVLQENVIIRLERGAKQGPVTVSTSTDTSFADLKRRDWDFADIISPNDPELFIHVPTADDAPLQAPRPTTNSLAQLGLHVSTGPVVDFRMRDHLRHMPGQDTVPLLYPLHLKGGSVTWPIEGSKKPNAIAHNGATEKWLFPSGWYVAVRRFSSKEEKRRVVASLIDPEQLPGNMIGLENHINVLHAGRRSLAPELARGLVIYLNSSGLDAEFRRFNGHTQVNATDLRQLSYPSKEQLHELGELAKRQWPTEQAQVDELVRGVLEFAS
jgi:tRNA1(Val) A37 N6-methylase TrmN6